MFTGIVSVILILLLSLLAHSPPVRDYVLQYGQDYLEASQQIQLDATRLEYNLFNLTATLRRVSLRSQEEPQKPPFLTAERIYLRLHLLDLIRGQLTIEEARFQDLGIRILLDERGRSNLPPTATEMDSSQASGKQPALLIEELTADGSFLAFEDQNREVSFSLPEWKLNIQGDRTRRTHTIRFSTLGNGNLSLRETLLTARSLNLDLQLTPEGLVVRSGASRIGDSEFSIRGTLTDLVSPQFDLRVSARLDLEQLAPLTGVEQRVDGLVDLQATIRNSLDDLQITADISGRDLTLEDLEVSRFSVRPVWNLASQQVALEEVQAETLGGDLRGHGTIALEPDGESRFQSQFENLDLSSLSAFLGWQFQIASRLGGQMNMAWKGLDFTIAAAGGRARLFDVRQPRKAGVLPLSGNVNFTLEQGQLTFETGSLNVLGAQLSGRWEFDFASKISAQLRAALGDVSETLSLLEAFLDQPLPQSLTALALSGPAELSASLSGTVDNPNLSIHASSRNLVAAGMQEIDVSTDIHYQSSHLDFEKLQLRWQGQEILGQGQIAFGSTEPSLNFSVQGEETSIAAVLEGLGNSLPVDGSVNFSLEVSGRTSAPVVEMMASASGLAAYGEILGTSQLKARLANGRIEMSQFEWEKPGENGQNGFVQATGQYELASGQYSFEARGRDLRFRTLELQEGIPIRGNLNLVATGSGSWEEPILSLRLQGQDVAIRDSDLGEVQLSGQLKGHEVELGVTAPYLSLNGKAQVKLLAPYSTEFEFLATRSELARLPLFNRAAQAVQGSMSGSFKGSAELLNWRSGQAEAHIDELRLITEKEELQNQGPLVVRLDSSKVEVVAASMVGKDNEFHLGGSLPFRESGPAGELVLQARLDPESLIDFVPGGEDWNLTGLFQVDATLRGSLASLDPSLSVTIREGTVAIPTVPTPFKDIQVLIQSRGDFLIVDTATATWASSEISATGQVPLGMIAPAGFRPRESNSDQIADLRIQIQDLALESIGNLPEYISGRASLVIQAQAAEPSLGGLTASARFQELSLRISDFEATQETATSVSLRDGAVHVDQLQLKGPDTSLSIAGAVTLTGPTILDLSAEGTSDLGLLSSIWSELRASGKTDFQVTLTGNLQAPQVSGLIDIQGGQAAIAYPPIEAESLTLGLRITPEKLSIEDLSGQLNGGEIRGSGEVYYSGTTIEGLTLAFSTKDVFLSFPTGLVTISESDIEVETIDDRFVVGGELRILGGSYRDQLDVESQLLAFVQSGKEFEVPEDRNPQLARLRYNLRIETTNPILVENNLAKLVASSNLRLVGTYYHPSLVGRLELEEGGELYLSERQYVIETGQVDFVNENRIEPSLNVVARTRVSGLSGGYEIEMRMVGNMEELEMTLSSEPPLPEPDIISVLLTGRTLEEAGSAGGNIAREQAMSYLAGRVGGRLSRQAQKRLGLSQMRIEPNLIAAESDPSVRLTVGQDLRHHLRLIYSMNLADSGDQIYIVEYDLTRRFNTRAIKQSDNSYRMGFRQDLQFGGSAAPRRGGMEKKIIGDIIVSGMPLFPEETLLKELELRSGARFDFFGLQQGADRLRRFYQREGYLESRVRVQQVKELDRVRVNVEVQAGPKVELLIEGIDLPSRVRRQVRESWRAGFIEAQRRRESVRPIQRWLIRSGYFQSKITFNVDEPVAETKVVRINIDPGVRYREVEVVFENGKELSADLLSKFFQDQDGPAAIHLEPDRIRNQLSNLYREQGYLDVRVGQFQLDLRPGLRTGQLVIPINEGSRYRFDQIQLLGNRAISLQALQPATSLLAGRFYSRELLETVRTRIEELYWSQGYNDVVVDFVSRLDHSASEVDVALEIEEKQRDVIAEVLIEGNDAVSESFIRRKLELRPGLALNFELADRSRRNLYNTGAFSLVDFETFPSKGSRIVPEQLVNIRARVREVRPNRMRYGAFFDTDRGPGATFEFENRNTLGSARVVGMRTRYDSELRELRGYFGQPLSWRLPATFNFSGFRSREIFERESLSDFLTDRTGFSLQHEVTLSDNTLLNYGYRFERAHTFDREPDPDCPLPLDSPICRFDESFNIAPLTGSFSWGTRDDLLDATRGFFTSHAVEFAPSLLGSDLRFIKYFGQFFKYIPLSTPSEVPFEKGLKRPRVVYAVGARIGLGKGFGGQNLIFSERFFAGGGTTVRGFEQNTLGPMDFFGEPIGGQAMFVLNNELRFPLASIFEGVSFLDVGNIYARATDFDPFDVRKTAGVGLRVRTPYFLLRLDYGLKLDRLPDESRGALFFSIGQAF